MRLCCIALFAGVAASTGASASSFVTVPLNREATSPSVVHLGAPPETAVAPKPAEAPAIEVALHYPAPLSLSFAAHADTPAEATKSQAVPDEKMLLALHYPPPLPGGIDASVAQTRVSASVIAMGEPAVEYFKAAAVKPETPARSLFAGMPLLMRGGIRGDAFPGGEAASTPETVPLTQASVPAGTPKSAPAKAPEPAVRETVDPPVDNAAEPSSPPRGIAPLKGVQ